jgi:hypothetical protein
MRKNLKLEKIASQSILTLYWRSRQKNVHILLALHKEVEIDELIALQSPTNDT